MRLVVPSSALTQLIVDVLVAPVALWCLWTFALAPLLGVTFVIDWYAWVVVVLMGRLVFPGCEHKTSIYITKEAADEITK